jgi:hypothetical protein
VPGPGDESRMPEDGGRILPDVKLFFVVQKVTDFENGCCRGICVVLDGLEFPGYTRKVAAFHRNGGNFERNGGSFAPEYALYLLLLHVSKHQPFGYIFISPKFKLLSFTSLIPMAYLS